MPSPVPAPLALRGKHRQTLAALFVRPERANVSWNDVVAMMSAARAVVTAGGGSAHSFVLLGRVLVLHRPHPGSELPKPAVKRIRRFLDGLGGEAMMKYQGYVAKTEIDPESGLIFGEVVGVRDMITFQGASVAEAVRAFHESVDLYLRTCAEQGLETEKPYSGSIVVRTKPRVHRALVALAKARGQSLNELVDRILTRTVRRAGLGAPAAPDELPAPRHGRRTRTKGAKTQDAS